MKWNNDHNARGQGLVEWALVLPMLVFFMMAIIEGGFMLNRQALLEQMAKEMVRSASIGATTEELEDRALNLSERLITPTNVVTTHSSTTTEIIVEDDNGKQLTFIFTPTIADREVGSPVNTTVDYVYEPFTPILNQASFPLSANANTLVEYLE